METKYDQIWSSTVGQSDDIGNVADKFGFVGKFSDASTEHRINSLSVGRTASLEQNTADIRDNSTTGVAGKIARQLIEETEKQLAYHKEQVETLERRLQELNQIPEVNTDID